MRKGLIVLALSLIVMLSAGASHASFIDVGKALYQGETYNLSYDDGLLVFEYANSPGDQQFQMDWAEALNSGPEGINTGTTSTTLTIFLDDGWVASGSFDWRLPTIKEYITYYESGDCDAEGNFWSSNGYGSAVALYFNMDEGYWDMTKPIAPFQGAAVCNVTLSQVPLPSAILLFSSGLAGFAVLRRRRSQ